MELKAGEKQIVFHFELSPTPIMVHADTLQLEQALINIIKNGIEAIPQQGVITFITRSYPRELIVCDSSTGIAPAIAEQLFSPFFSTKKDGQGIGLTLTREILLNHGYEFSLRTIEPWVYGGI
ncbi:ATP-binding protein [Paraflavitalea speifideaquila]|uniref:ATP-binding protein n=1 Tax=Paraflavitalea speifideaquila TaxID=3076558 RepID=UPI0028EF7F84|nr:ATP-binding protein [Paraflavitalea speifideiaquila]